MPTPPFLYNLNNVHWRADNKTILSDLSINIPANKVVGIIGANGAGKTSLLKLLHGQKKPTSGELLYNDTSLLSLTPRQRAQQIAFVSQHPPHVFDLTVTEVVKAGRLPHMGLFSFGSQTEHEPLITKALSKFRLMAIKEQSFDSLSGGEQQRTYLAQAMVQNADTLLLDEPINHLDIRYQLQIMQTLKSMQSSVILTLHDLNLANQYCDYLVLLHQGQVLASGLPETVLTPDNILKAYGIHAYCMDDKQGVKTMVYCLAEDSGHD